MTSSSMMYCSRCGQSISAEARFCPSCGAPVSSRGPVVANVGGPLPRKDPAIAAVLALLLGLIGLFGVGHMYAGRVSTGVMWLVLGLFLNLLAFFFAVTIIGLVIAIPIWLGLFALWIVLIFTAYSTAKEYNAAVQATGRPPW